MNYFYPTIPLGHGRVAWARGLRRLFQVATLAVLLPGAAGAATLGPATGYGAFVFGDFAASASDNALNLAAGGNVSLDGYSVGGAVTPASAALLAAGGNVAASNGQVGAGGAGAIRAGGAITGSITANGGKFAGSSPIDFGAAAAILKGSSTFWAGFTPNGTADQSFGSLSLTGASLDLNVFSVHAAVWNAAGTVSIVTPIGSTNLLNISGSDVIFQNGQITINGSSGPNSLGNATTLYNLYEATSLSLPGSKPPQGTVFAAFADVTGGFGQLNGQLIAQSFVGNTQINRPAFDGGLVLNPVPAGLPLLAAGLAGLGLFAHNRRRSQMA